MSNLTNSFTDQLKVGALCRSVAVACLMAALSSACASDKVETTTKLDSAGISNAESEDVTTVRSDDVRVVLSDGVAGDLAGVDEDELVVQPGGIEVTSYAAEYSVSSTEARRRLDRMREIQNILADLREFESERLAGWGIDHEGDFGGWIWLTGDEPAGTEATAVANAYADIGIRTGATHSLEELMAAQRRFGAGPPELSAIVTFTSLNFRANGMEIGIDPGLNNNLPTPLPGISDLPQEEGLQAAIAAVTEQLVDRINVRFKIVDGSGIGHDAEE